MRAFFDNQFIVNNGRWFGMYFIGHGAMLALGLATGLVQWIGAIEAALTVPLAIGIARRVYGGRVAALAGVFLVLSPFFIFVSATHLSQPTSSLFLALFVYSAVRIEAAAREVRWWVVAAAALSAAAIVRPQAAAVVALPFLARLAVLLARRQVAPTALGLGAGLLVLGLGATAFLSINHALTGHALRTSYHAYWETVRPLDFRTGPWYPFRELAQNLAHLNFWLFGWPLSLAFVPFFRRSGLGLTLAAVPGLLLAGQALLGVPTVAAVGPVYFAEAIVPLAILSASGFAEAVAWARRRFADAWPTRFVLAAPVAGTLAALVVFVPAQVASLRLMADIARAPYDLVKAEQLTHAVVFVHSLPARHQAPGAWVYHHRNPRPDLSDDVLFVRDLGRHRNADLVRYLGDRTPYVMGMRDGRLVLVPVHTLTVRRRSLGQGSTARPSRAGGRPPPPRSRPRPGGQRSSARRPRWRPACPTPPVGYTAGGHDATPSGRDLLPAEAGPTGSGP